MRSTPALEFSTSFANRYAAAEKTSHAAFSDLDLTYAPHLNPNRFWIEGFGAYGQGQSKHVGRAIDVLSSDLVAGVDVPLDALTSQGVIAGFGVSTLENKINTQVSDATRFYAGFYNSTQAMGVAWDVSLTLGYTDYNTQRVIAGNLVASGLKTSKVDYGGFFIAPQIAMTRDAENPSLAMTSAF